MRKLALALIPAVLVTAATTEQAAARGTSSTRYHMVTTTKTTLAARTYTIRSGDTLSSIAQDQLGDASKWQALYRDNRATIGPNPSLIYPGQKLRLAVGTAPKPKPTPHERGNSTTTWDRLAQCESGGNWHINTSNGFYGGLQFTLTTWRAFGGTGMPHNASKAEQIRIAEKALHGQGPGAWPVCSYKAGMR
ncbi:transglycosylase family protein [Streptomyces rimosus]|uniref:transglycosylase family protein n=1 Tax=Streptomyces rimosus TaxID=1927 RepID=UPI000B0471C1|nr:transglycosylase family protein [Streptomyces rimosus]